MPAKWHQAEITNIIDESPTTKRFIMQLADEDLVKYLPGQFMVADLPIGEKRLNRWRSYSLADIPNEKNEIEFCIVHLEGGKASEYFFNTVEEGTSLKLKAPDGTFCLPEGPIEKDLVFLCTGTGVAPFRTMIKHIFEHDIPHKNIHLIFGTRFQEGILYQEEFEQLAEQHPEFSFDIALSKEESDHDYFKGYIHQVYLDKYKDVRSDIDFYICGWSQMIDDAVANLLIKLKYDKSQIKYELYG